MSSDPIADRLRQRLLAEIPQQKSATRKTRRVVDALLLLSAVVVPLAIWWNAGGVRVQSRPLWFVIGTAIGWIVVAAWAVWGSLAKGSSMLGLGRRWMRWIILLTPTLLFAWMMAWDLIYTPGFSPWPGRWGRLCLNLTILMGAWPLVALLLLRRGSSPQHPGIRGAAIGAAVGCSTGVLTDLWCPIADPSHVLLGHILPLVILSVAGLVLGKWLLAVRRQRRNTERNRIEEDRHGTT